MLDITFLQEQYDKATNPVLKTAYEAKIVKLLEQDDTTPNSSSGRYVCPVPNCNWEARHKQGSEYHMGSKNRYGN
jgi:hypothetical protein